ncbi:MAG: ATPase, T2SS/T4P/T4SS family [Methanotrichaceae archaeon]
MVKCVVPDTSVVIDGRVSKKVKSGEYLGRRIVIPEAVVAELEAQANHGREIGIKGLEELKRLSVMAKSGKIEVEYVGVRPDLDQIKLAGGGEIDAMIRDVALEIDADFLTSDVVQSRVAEAMGIDVKYIRSMREGIKPLTLEKYFTPDTLSVHLKEHAAPMAKRGKVGEFNLIKIGKNTLSESELREMVREIFEHAKVDPRGQIEMEKVGAAVVQLGPMRIAIARPPFSDGLEITAVRPVAQVDLEDYKHNKELKTRLSEVQRGILIAGPPGSGKSTFAASIAKYLYKCSYVVKTLESPRDLQVPSEVTQYGPLEGSMESSADLLLMVRPDYTIYDEVRKTKDFQVFTDLRLAGVGMIGVVHANKPIDAIQRLIGRVDLGVIPQVVDTVIFIEKGEVSKVMDVEFEVKVPSGMIESDLARPVIVVKNFETKKAEYELYTYGEEIVIMPISKGNKKPASWKLASRQIEEEMARHIKGSFEVEMLSDSSAVVRVQEKEVPKVIGKAGQRIDQIEKSLGVHIDIQTLDNSVTVTSKTVIPKIEETNRYLVIQIDGKSGERFEVCVGGESVFTATVGRRGDIRMIKSSDLAKQIMKRLEHGEKLEARRV